jgi:rhodanese-related sulfurtransferase
VVEQAGDAVAAHQTVTISPTRAAELWRSGEAAFVDVRRPYEREGGRIEGSSHIVMNELSGRAGEVPKDRPVVFYCRSGNRSAMVAEAFRQAGWDAYHIDGGLAAWVEEGLPLDPPDGTVRDPLPGS